MARRKRKHRYIECPPVGRVHHPIRGLGGELHRRPATRSKKQGHSFAENLSHGEAMSEMRGGGGMRGGGISGGGRGR